VLKCSSAQVRRPQSIRLTSAFCILTSAFCVLLSSCRPSVPHPASPAPRPSLPTVELRVKDARVFAEVVSKPEDRSLGLMFRRSMAPDSGMLFVFDSDDFQRFWMKNTLIPLSIAYVTRDSLITDILEMAPLDTTTPYRSSRAVRYALEMNSGWFQTRGIKPGDTVRGIPAH
jgi:uncharacterized membrane protein (UPF0127 family)